jgi:hypothetical protein
MTGPDIPDHDLSLAGSIIDKAIEHMMGKNVNGIAIASALLGGAMESVESGEMRQNAGKDHAGEA